MRETWNGGTTEMAENIDMMWMPRRMAKPTISRIYHLSENKIKNSEDMKKDYLKPALRVSETEIDLMKAYPWSDMPGTGGYAYPQAKEENVNEDESEWGNLW